MAPHDPEHRRQPEPAAGELGREEGVEELLEGLSLDAEARVGDLEIGVLALGQLVVQIGAGQVLAVGAQDGGSQLDHARTAADRLRRVCDQIHDDLSQLSRIRVDDG